MGKEFCIVFCMFVCSVYLSQCEDMVMFISQGLGQDVGNCTLEDYPCKTLQYCYQEAMINQQIRGLNFVLLDNYNLSGSFYINMSHPNLTTLKIYSREDEKIKIFGGRLGEMVFGCNEHEICIGYGIILENLMLHGFQKKPVITVKEVPLLRILNSRFFTDGSAAVRGFNTAVEIHNSLFSGLHNDDTWNKSSDEMSFEVGGVVGLLFSNSFNKTVLIRKSIFSNNTANNNSIKDNNTFFSSLNLFRYSGGGISVQFRGNSTLNRFSIRGCQFESNRALYGGAVAVHFTNESSENTLEITDTRFLENYALKSGGAFYIRTFDDARNTTILFRNVSFLRNVASIGGGAGKVMFESRDSLFVPPSFIEDTQFKENRAQIGAALDIKKTSCDLLSWLPFFVIFKNSEFIGNTAVANNSFIHTGTLSAIGSDLTFVGSNLFKRNTLNSAIYASKSNVNVSGHLTFSFNVAYHSGGGISLIDGSSLLLMPGSNLKFYGNYAVLFGGAIFYQSNFIDTEVYPFNPVCFMRYGVKDLPASKWNARQTSINFVGNGAGFKGAAVYANTLSKCRWVEVFPYINITKALRWSDRFVYRGNYLGSFTDMHFEKPSYKMDIATDSTTYDYTGATEIYDYPGAEISLQLSGKDELNNSVEISPSIFNADYWRNGTRSFHTSLRLQSHQLYKESFDSKSTKFKFSMSSKLDYENIKGKEDSKIHAVEIIDYSSIYGARLKLTIKPRECGPGYKFNSSSLQCVCDHDIYGLTRCRGKTIRLTNEMWANVSQKDPSKLVTYHCPKSYCDCDSGDQYESDCQFHLENPRKQCAEGRDGNLCGKCVAGKSITLPSYSCKTCSSFSSSLATFVIVIIFTLFVCIGIVYFNPKLSEYLKGIFFYTQILPYVFLARDDSYNVAEKFCTIINSVAVGSMPIEMCLFEGLDIIDAIGVSYIIPSLCTFVLVTVFTLSKVGLLTFHRDSPFNAFWMLIIVAYKLLVETSMKSLTCVNIDDDFIFFYDGSVKCFSKRHLALFIPSASILIGLVFPLPVVVFLISLGYVRSPPHVSDIISRGYRNDCRWWCGVDLMRRMAFAAVYTFVPDSALKQALFIFLSVLIYLAHSVAKPYQNSFVNHGESLLLASLCLISGLQAVESERVREVGSIMALAPSVLYTCAVFVYLSSRKIAILVRRWRAKKNWKHMNQSPKNVHVGPYNVPKRVLFERPNFSSNRRESVSENENQSSPSEGL